MGFEKEHYDVLVLGTHPIAWLGGMLAASEGAQVLWGVLPEQRSFEQRWSLAEPVFFGGLEKQFWGKILDEITSKKDFFSLEKPWLVTPEFRMTIEKNDRFWKPFLETFLETKEALSFLELSRNVSKKSTLFFDTFFQEHSIKEAQKKLQKTILKKHRVFQKWFEKDKIISDSFQQWLEGVWYLFSSSEFPVHFQNGCYGVLEAFLSQSFILKKPLEFLRRNWIRERKCFQKKNPFVWIERIFVDRKKVRGVQLVHSGKVLSCDHVLIGTPLDWVRTHLWGLQTDRSWVQECFPKPVSFRKVRVGFEFSLPSAFVPEVVSKSRVFFYQKNSSPIEVSWYGPELEAHQGTLWVQSQFSIESPSDFERWSRRLLRTLFDYFPFLDQNENVLWDSMLHQIPLWKPVLEQPYAHTTDLLRVYEGKGIGSQLPFEGMALVSQEAYPQWGLFGSAKAFKQEWKSIR